ncbi:MAG TPA: hypothetical protein VGG30_09940, partial [Pirellulales bacterium]
EEDNDQCLQQVAALATNLQSPGVWQAIFSADQINGWLAVDLTRNYADVLPAEIRNPRIDFHSGAATLACTYRNAGHETVVSIAFDLYLTEPNVIALRLRRVRAGLLPVPLAEVLKAIEQTGRGIGMLVQWRQMSGDPVALVHMLPGDDDENQLQLEAVELREGEIYIAGRTTPPQTPELARRQDHPPTTSESADDEAAQMPSGEDPHANDAESSAGEDAEDAETEDDDSPAEPAASGTRSAAVPAADEAPTAAAAPKTVQVGSAVKKNRQR